MVIDSIKLLDIYIYIYDFNNDLHSSDINNRDELMNETIRDAISIIIMLESIIE